MAHAPGIWLEDDTGRWVAMLPGVPREMRGMLDDTLISASLRGRISAATVVRSRTVRHRPGGARRSHALLADTFDPERIPCHGSTERSGLSPVWRRRRTSRVTVRGLPASEADRQLAESIDALRAVVGEAAYGEYGADLAAVVLDLCRARALTVAVAESCTGGLLGARLTAIPGSSDVVLGGVIAYHNDVKQRLLSVDGDDLATQGAVSEPVVRQMATGVRSATGASIGMAITGVAGPSGGTPGKPVGNRSCWIAVETPDGAEARLLRVIGDRQEIRNRSVQATLDMARRLLSRPLHPEP